jgi:group I intron endonuclease
MIKKKNYWLKRTTGIYGIAHIATGRQYVGQSVDCFERFKQHSTPKKNSAGIKGAIMKYGVDAFSFVILEECSKEKLNEREVWWIAELGTLSPGGYNLTSGGGQGTVVSEETRAKASASLKGKTLSPETRAKISAAQKGKTLSPEHCEKISAAAKGRTSCYKGKSRSPEAIAAVVEGRRCAKTARIESFRRAVQAARAADTYTEPLLEALQSLKTDKTWTTMAEDMKPPAGPQTVAPPTLEELETLLRLL